jgi:integrase
MLSDTKVKNAKKRSDAYKVTDRDALYLYVSKKGARSFRYDYRCKGRRKTLVYGLYPDVTLKVARERHTDARRLLAAGGDPAAKKRQDRHQAVRVAANTLKGLAEDWYAELAPHKSHSWRDNARRWLDKRVYPAMGSTPAAEVTSADVLALIKGIATKRPKTAEYVRQMLSRIFTYGARNLRCPSDPAHAVRGAVVVPPATHHKPISSSEIPAFLATIRAYQGRRATVIAAELLLLTCVRKYELLGAEVAEIDSKAGQWRIPAARMKSGLDHIVPLSARALELMREAVSINFGSKYVFPHFGNPRLPMSKSTLNLMFDRCGLSVTPHAMRATFSTAANESGKFRADVIERALAHVERNRVRAAYNAAEYLPERRELMRWWADFVSGATQKRSEKVTAIAAHPKRARA